MQPMDDLIWKMFDTFHVDFPEEPVDLYSLRHLLSQDCGLLHFGNVRLRF